MAALLLVALLCVCHTVQSVRLDEFGGIPSNSSIQAALANAEAFKAAVSKAASLASMSERVVEIPAGQVYYMYTVLTTDVDNLVINVSGTLIAHDNYTYWEIRQGGYGHFLQFVNCNNLTITGNGDGVIDGQGYNWWLEEILVQLHHGRPHLISVSETRNLLIEKIHMKNSPCYHIQIGDAMDVILRYISIKVDVWKQKELFDTLSNGWLNGIIPLFPLNTDGIDPSGKNMHIHDIYVENYDDAIVIKPAHGGYKYASCSENILVENIRVKYGVGMSIGSVPPHDQVNCIRNVTFRNVDFESPFKAIYIKTNPGDSGSGIIQNILYEDITVDFAIWWAIYIGPQQQKQPDGGGPGCMIYPLNPNCETQPRVSIDNIRLRNVSIKSTLLFPGIVRCNASRPCTNFEFDNVHVGGLNSFLGYISENIQGNVIDSYPIPKFN
eukprot:TRINITY_DN11249_c0_g1_i1.p1 TRINITY_DN11249_c0_g1~~TRINITY_DN11249_c0_g1_i1.p1  ORF type:complete len:439 (+),score=108.58 TRINITY_DN11249_c0_g1_i1:67-1383(+)